MRNRNVRSASKKQITLNLDDRDVVIIVAKKRLPARSAIKLPHNEASRAVVPEFMLGSGFTHGYDPDE
jgi:hypothetical protein